MTQYSDQFKQKIANEYSNGESVNQLAKKYKIDYGTIRRWVAHLPDNMTGRFSQRYEICDEYALIYVKYHGEFKKVKIDIEDVERCKNVGIWSYTSNGYIVNCKSKLYLHRFIMNCPNGLEIDHVHHDLLDCRKSELRVSTSSQQKMNTKLRKDNVSGHRGVCYDEKRQKWCVYVQSKNRRVAKRFDEFKDACAYGDQMRSELHGEFMYQGGEAV